MAAKPKKKTAKSTAKPKKATHKPAQKAKAKAKKRIEGLLAQVKGGADFAALAKANSQDPVSAQDDGYLPPAERTAWAPEFSEAGWKLKPGEISGVVTTLYGYHILRYPTAEEAIPRLASSVQQLQMRTMDSTYFADLNTEFKIEVAPDAAAKMRAVLDAIDAQRAREILDELRKRSGEALRPPSELDYIDRLLKRF